MIPGVFNIDEIDFSIGTGLSLLAGFLIGAERESKGKAAGIGTHCFVIGGSMIFTYISALVDPNSTSRIAAQIVTGIGFLGAGIILKGELFDNKESNDPTKKKVVNLTTAASIWFSGSIGMAIGFNLYFIAIISIIFALVVPRIPKVGKRRQEDSYE
ncbi:MgtC/SapB family protein [Candidatus Nitrosocosmicus agrestis]|jgi:putative Mg2+ transporter-C (MgtC) family protein|uniref:MgtC/SapB family protein n=1 Tax=Candidatus Nitrosocosmicus agrestis TaxID=2563600 RepID=UPI00122E86D2|nr:MgtC/SapB family protein [Candidatus Nitrosocosmicus sp. SS]KAA2283392.1 MgtC/SapB family protein [Candidatus Nitrosocosmicus sp. SS]KAF0868962.1 MgtC/SapB family protein [Candidatus Nitrosocosmicus sp. SS]